MSDTRDPAELRAQAARMRQEARELEALAELRDAEAAAIERLRARNQGDNVPRVMTQTARQRISRGRSTKATGTTARFLDAADTHGHTMRTLAKAVTKETGRPLHQPTVSMALKGDKRIRLSAARVIEALIGYKATAANWPAGWLPED